MTAGFYDWNTQFKDFECYKNGVDVSIHNIKGDFFIRMDGGGGESVQMVLNRDEFAEFVKHCQTMVDAA
jgi:hypothetical protein